MSVHARRWTADSEHVPFDAPSSFNFLNPGPRHHRSDPSRAHQHQHLTRPIPSPPIPSTNKVLVYQNLTLIYKKMSFLFGGRPQLSSEQKIAAAEAEIDMVSDMYSRYVSRPFQ